MFCGGEVERGEEVGFERCEEGGFGAGWGGEINRALESKSHLFLSLSVRDSEMVAEVDVFVGG